MSGDGGGVCREVVVVESFFRLFWGDNKVGNNL